MIKQGQHGMILIILYALFVKVGMISNKGEE